MLFEIIIALEFIAFLFLAMGISPATKSVNFEGNDNQPPYLNKIIFVGVSAILFFILGIFTVSYDYNYCYISETTADYVLNKSTSVATCDSYKIENTGLAYLNYLMGLMNIIIMIVLILFASSTKHVMNEH